LIVSANSHGTLPAADQEATTLAADISADLHTLGIACEVVLLLGAQASYGTVRQHLRDGRYHIFHYAGHGHYSEDLPEVSGLILYDGNDRKLLTAADLKLLVEGTDLYMAFLSCCLGARSATETGYGDFGGMLEALGRAGVPVVLG